MDLNGYFSEVCVPAVQEFQDAPCSFFRAWTASVALFHFKDWYLVHLGLTEDPFESFKAECREFGILREIANANKHFIITRNPTSMKGLTADAAVVDSGCAFSDGSYFSDGSSFSDSAATIVVDFSGNKIDVLHLCNTVFVFLESKISAKSI
jgi:hypothetical protein